ncbi:hypothetical protein [Mangrovivirga cuniculi]|uniref:DUF304 domain-containing protein n=1 Tax=Mangrovivirga cuniculi TaxID=2715131 RepID=A0A4D7K438_9BACT|nr:hypothetical protein [Mangrovivirga cuniculi]QCK15574.1 hypothetical protein DCC35_12865 [Mangrovivirga cuniculi]
MDTRVRLSSNNKFLNIFTPLSLSIFFIFYIIEFSEELKTGTPLVVTIIIGIILLLTIINGFKDNNEIYYDTDYLYITRNKETIQIPINNVQNINWTTRKQKILGIFLFYLYEINYLNNNGINSEISFWIGSDSSKIDDFRNTILNRKK